MNVSDFESQETLRIAIRRELDSLHPGEILATHQMVDWILKRSGADKNCALSGQAIA